MILNVGSEFEPLIELAHKYVAEYPTVEQIILVKTAKENVHICLNDNYIIENDVIMKVKDFKDEKDFVQRLVDADDVEIKDIVCMWKNGSVEGPSYHFKESILEICPKNEDAIYVAQGIDGMVFKRIKSAMPAKG